MPNEVSVDRIHVSSHISVENMRRLAARIDQGATGAGAQNGQVDAGEIDLFVARTKAELAAQRLAGHDPEVTAHGQVQLGELEDAATLKEWLAHPHAGDIFFGRIAEAAGRVTDSAAEAIAERLGMNMSSQ